MKDKKTGSRDNKWLTSKILSDFRTSGLSVFYSYAQKIYLTTTSISIFLLFDAGVLVCFGVGSNYKLAKSHWYFSAASPAAVP